MVVSTKADPGPGDHDIRAVAAKQRVGGGADPVSFGAQGPEYDVAAGAAKNSVALGRGAYVGDDPVLGADPVVAGAAVDRIRRQSPAAHGCGDDVVSGAAPESR